jgi:hypothetical protein
MKKARIMLTAIAVFAVIGGAFALKSTYVTKASNFLYFETTNPGQCDFTVNGFTLAAGNQAGVSRVVSVAPAACPINAIRYNVGQ